MTQTAQTKVAEDSATPSALPFDERLLDAKLEAVEARVELKLGDRISALGEQIRDMAVVVAGLSGKQDTLADTLGQKPGVRTIWAAAGSIFLGVLALLAFGGQTFSGGMSASSAFADELVASKERDSQRLRELREQNDKLDRLIKRGELGQ